MRLLTALLFPLLLAASPSLLELKQSPGGLVRDFNIWQYLQGDINASQADQAYSLVNGYSQKLFTAYAKKTQKQSVKEQYRCSQLDPKALLEEQNASCVNVALTLGQAVKLSHAEREKLSSVLKEAYPSKSEMLLLMNSEQFGLNALQSGAGKFLTLFNELDYASRHKYFDLSLTPEQVNALAQEKSFEQALKYIVTDAQMVQMQTSLLALSPQELSAQSYFFLALNALGFKAINKALFYLELAQKKATTSIDSDKALFWKYLVSKDETFLKELTQSSSINIYTLYAKEKLQIKVENYFTALPAQKKASQHEQKDPYAWEAALNEIRNADEKELGALLERYSGKEDMVLQAFIYAKAKNYKTHNFIMPYQKATNTLSNDDKALLYALARQESYFIPTAISHSYALGVMQIMPFLVKALAKEKKEEITLNEMFDPSKNIAYATTHLNYLQKHLYHPLFIAYAYNGGIGFTKRHLLQGTFSKGSYEPYLSMELMANTQSREYGKKVLANYVIYKKILGEEVKITSLFETLTQPSRTDRFRTKALASTN
ncbi:MAG: lytic transglycosylase domain-containing protein [Campylobacterales bacterium]|nr:lytic transglycosylase domain-containing protein [Campylobacterales bacterium]